MTSTLRKSNALETARKEFLEDPNTVGYNTRIESIRATEYPQLKDITYLDHAGATLYATSLLTSFTTDLTSNLYGNPHSRSLSAQLTGRRIDDLRFHILQLFQANPVDWDVVFCANATAGIKLIADAFVGEAGKRGGGWGYRYHGDAHTSVVGVRELADWRRCFSRDGEVEEWLRNDGEQDGGLALFAWPAQSNFTGRRLDRSWAARVREKKPNTFTLLDAASYVTTTALDLSSTKDSPDFIALSLYKIFGFPDLGCLLVQRSSAAILLSRKYFGGGTVDAVVSLGTSPYFHAKRTDSPHAHLEDGTLPFHALIALEKALETHKRLFGTYQSISAHTLALASWLYARMSSLKHREGPPLVRWYSSPPGYLTQGPILAFTLLRPSGLPIPHSDIESLASVKSIHIRTGGLCNPGGIENALGISASEVEKNFKMGHKCWGGRDVMNGKPTGAVRVSLGAMSVFEDVWRWTRFLEECYLDRAGERGSWGNSVLAAGMLSGGGMGGSDVYWRAGRTGLPHPSSSAARPGGRVIERKPQLDSIRIEAVIIYPIKSCAPFHVPSTTAWPVTSAGLLHDRSFAILHAGTARALTVKQYPLLAEIVPVIDLSRNTMRISLPGGRGIWEIPLGCCATDGLDEKGGEGMDIDSGSGSGSGNSGSNSGGRSSPATEEETRTARVCGREMCATIIPNSSLNSALSAFLGSPVTLAQVPRSSSSSSDSNKSNPKEASNLVEGITTTSMANTSPLLICTLPSLRSLNSTLPHSSSISPDQTLLNLTHSLRPNLILDTPVPLPPTSLPLTPYLEESFLSFSIIDPLDPGAGVVEIGVEGRCRRCRAVGGTVYEAVVKEREGWFGMLCGVRRGGWVRVGGRVGRVRRREG